METKKLAACFALIVAAASATTALAHEGHDHGAPEASPPSPGKAFAPVPALMTLVAASLLSFVASYFN
ncbi:hypothetical protein BHE74_00009314 [Ensete ventricosum]|uniref:Uncharacterized protein n=1 Tax=Ensete ventricosum TaxID=4639 RepID=A0A427ATE4_ENSVE|nr:hypothetical protein B296_00013394 [Ensete ventricosum]RWW14966.1 hypothetical protein GW17_00021221 [Ensete ventricosum]RWW82233.1 hypothetical protein BHE74_00009314 [Ensete ventricosum]RZR72309.1 hypothetical protein BHM03_00012322 [Ensete ventricosum]